MARNYAALFHEYLEEFADLTDAEFGRLARALLVYSRTGEFPALNGNERLFKRRVMMQEDRAQENYGAIAERNRANGANGGRPVKPKKTQNNPEKPNETQDNPENLNQNQYQYQAFPNGKEYIPPETPNGVSPPLQGGKRARRFTPPSVDDVRAYCQERGNRVDAQRFVDFYAAKGWMVGRNPMKDWKAAVRTWERSEDRGPDTDSGGDQGQKWDVPGALYL